MTDIILPFIEITESVRHSLAALRFEEAQVTLHIRYQSKEYGNKIRIWPTTFLLPEQGGKRGRLVAANNICLSPEWLHLPIGAEHLFSLLFTGLPEDCKKFHLWEDIPGQDGFFLKDIERNATDVYQISL